ncbi:hypothetical protein KA001_03115 [Patescibacteria group bacterium]|nr:hypothetical protein [Patescibacteria group bacterium]
MEKTKENRNKAIYEYYLESGLSFNKLSKKYNLSPQRIQKIVSDYKAKNIAQNLAVSSTFDERNLYKNLAVETREGGNLDLALQMFKIIETWDEANKNYRGLGDIQGHMSIIYNKLSDAAKKIEDKKKNLEYSIKHLEKALDIQNKGLTDGGAKAITQVQISATKNRLAKNLEGKEKKDVLLDALDIINLAIMTLPGSKAHKAWPLKVKAQILAHLEKYDEAIDALMEAERHLYLGYMQEMNWTPNERKIGQKGNIGNDQAIMKLLIWHTGIQLTYAEIYEKTERDVLAKFYASAVLNAEDSNGLLRESKKQAKLIFDRVN